jgi:predicted DNA-binding transcriptional regulator YafY
VRRADRLFRLVQLLRRSRLLTAQRIAQELEVSERTVYRDIRDLALSGVPIRGEAGVGYALDHGFDLPPLMFSEDEIEALVLGARVVQGTADPQLARAADSVLAKVEMVLPDRLRSRVSTSPLMVPHLSRAPNLGILRLGIRERRRARFDYVDLRDAHSSRTVRPLGVAFWGKVWTLAAWCETRNAFRGFRLDRMSDVRLAEGFVDERGKTLDDYILEVSQQFCSRDRIQAAGALGDA